MSTSSSPPGDGLACPSCGRAYPPDERFCEDCGMPLVKAGGADVEEPRSEAHERARKIRPEYSRGEVVRVAGGRNQAEAEFIQNLLLEEGIPSILRRSAGFDVPDFLAAGQRDVLVPESGARAARELLDSAELGASRSPAKPPPRPAFLVVAIVGGGLAAALVAWLLMQAG